MKSFSYFLYFLYSIYKTCRKIYWSDWGNDSKIERADLNGDKREVLVDEGTFWPNGIALDPQHRRLYWVDARKYSVSYIELDSKKTIQIFENAYHPFGITIFEKYVYWTDWFRKVVRLKLTENKKNQKERVVRITNISSSIS